MTNNNNLKKIFLLQLSKINKHDQDYRLCWIDKTLFYKIDILSIRFLNAVSLKMQPSEFETQFFLLFEITKDTLVPN